MDSVDFAKLIFANRQNFWSLPGYEYGVFEVCRELPVPCNCGPTIRLDVDFMGSKVDHRLDG
jgi:hypothetical protein